VPTPDPTLEGTDPTQKQWIRPLIMLPEAAEAAEAALLLRSSQLTLKPGLGLSSYQCHTRKQGLKRLAGSLREHDAGVLPA
jgi:hypothetical protein